MNRWRLRVVLLAMGSSMAAAGACDRDVRSSPTGSTTTVAGYPTCRLICQECACDCGGVTVSEMVMTWTTCEDLVGESCSAGGAAGEGPTGGAGGSSAFGGGGGGGRGGGGAVAGGSAAAGSGPGLPTCQSCTVVDEFCCDY